MIGYNVNEINALMQEIAEAYKNLGIYTKEQWNPLLFVLQGQWIGEDEQDFEKKLAERICKLYSEACTLAENSIKTIRGMAEAWRQFQQKNTLDGNSSVGDARFGIKDITITRDDKIVSPNIKTIADNANRGLQSEQSGELIKQKVEEFVKTTKDKTNGLFQAIETNKAFMGNQANGLKTYLERVGIAIGDVTVAVKDMYDALDNLAKQNYSSSIDTISSELTQASSNVDSSTEGLSVWK